MKKKNNNKIISIIQVCVVVLLPVIILGRSDLSKFQLPYIPLLVWALIAPGIMLYERWTWKDVGIRVDNIKKGLLSYALFTVIAAIFVSVYFNSIGKSPNTNIFQYWHFKFFFIPISIFQELVYRSFLLTKMREITSNKIFLIASNVIAFFLLHIFFPDISSAYPLPIIGGLGWIMLYYWCPNLILASISHIILNFLSVMYG